MRNRSRMELWRWMVYDMLGPERILNYIRCTERFMRVLDVYLHKGRVFGLDALHMDR